MKLEIFLCLCFVITLGAYQSSASFSESSNQSCPIWTTPKVINGTTGCECGNTLNSVVVCETNNFAVHILLYYCMSYSDEFNTTVVGRCLYHLHHEQTYQYKYYWLIPRLTQRNDTALCQFHKYYGHTYQYQTGRMCTECVNGYAYPVYSYSLACVECKDYKYNWLKYIAVAFLPLTVFYIIVILFRISVTSGAMNGYVLMCQLLTTPMNVRLFNTIRNKFVMSLYVSFHGIWNLDFFRGLYTPFCLHPKLTTLQTLMLDYVIAVYPLILIIVTYICVKLHNHYSLVVWLWSPFYKCFALIRNEWDINRSLVDAFATFILLSNLKILEVSFYILAPNTLYDIKGVPIPKKYLYYDGTYEYFGKDHIPYALLALFMVFVFNIFPLVLLCLYPCRCFQRCLNYCNLRCLTLHIFMDTFNGCYKLKPRDCRYFAALYLLLRIVNHSFILTNTVPPLYSLMTGMVLIGVTVCIATIRPHKRLLYTVIDTALLANLDALYLWGSAYRVVLTFDSNQFKYLNCIFLVSAAMPFFYGIGLLLYVVIPQKCLLKLKAIFHRMKLIITRQTNSTQPQDPVPYRLEHSDEYPPLLPVLPESL